MPALKNQRYELFAQAMAQAVGAAEAYRSAGYDVAAGAAASGAARLLKKTEIAERIGELKAASSPPDLPGFVEPGDATATPSVGSALRELEEARRVAIAKGQAAAAISAIMAKAKLAGLLGERSDGAPPPTGFDGNYTEAARRIAFLLRLAEEEHAPVEPMDEAH